MNKLALGGLVLLLVGGCVQQPAPEYQSEGELVEVGATENQADDGVSGVSVSQQSGETYQFAVTIQSEETGCDRYANWWEVITEDGTLLYRRILAHSHVNEQPFTRSGGPVEIAADEVVIVRSHLHPTGYQPQAMKGSFTSGFEPTQLPVDFASELAEQEPLPTGCAF